MTVNFSTHHQGNLSVIDLFAGSGGWDLACKALGFDPLGVEIDDAACATRAAAGLRTIPGDVAALDPRCLPCRCTWSADEVAGMVTPFHRAACPQALAGEALDLLIASPPCQAWSTAGKQAGKRDQAIVFACLGDLAAGNDTRSERLAECEDDRSLLVVEPLRWALDLRPRLIAFEQVPPVLEVWSMVAQILAGEGYSTWAGILSAEQYGVPQTRERAILLADRDGQVVPPAPTHAKYVKPKKERDDMALFEAPREVDRIVRPEDRDLLPWVSMAEALPRFSEGASPSPTVSGGGTGSGGGVEVFASEASRERASAAVRLVNGNQDNATEREADEPASTIAFGHNAARVEWVYRNGNQENAAERPVSEPAPTLHFGARSNKVDWVYDRRAQNSDGSPVPPVPISRPAPTLTANGLAKSTHQWVAERPATTVNGDPRISKPGRHDPEESGSQQKDAIRVTLEEAAILQSFPPDYPFQGTKSQRFLQVGNAVPPLLAHAILSALIPAELLPAAVEPELEAEAA